MDEQPPAQNTQQTPPVSREQPGTPVSQDIEPDEQGGEAPCWAHLLDDDGQLE
jgi:hypothetical protein